MSTLGELVAVLDKHDLRRWMRIVKGDGNLDYLRCYCGEKIYEDSNEAMLGHVAAALVAEGQDDACTCADSSNEHGCPQHGPFYLNPAAPSLHKEAHKFPEYPHDDPTVLAIERGYRKWEEESGCHEVGCGCVTVWIWRELAALHKEGAGGEQAERLREALELYLRTYADTQAHPTVVEEANCINVARSALAAECAGRPAEKEPGG